ncbi:MAG TPA: NADH-dependent [FeFe] hydrogenase, group A6 [Bacteroidales bacterium]|nr:NADH-dependent [FeFe] hydrogenase, group A6 [Bacteroidales bacterium]HPF03488.1 NADH-dependent [FeFe] hydrogenase, group A6 [Bacteroidales bacterium]HPJ58292.1 NADH-dependent [FeFe] hydrogenase, group A6 [Bacteroidales bacterium]HPR10902.1 NADH-dependent [FeFe] hydrogenase, group A6 [Bacteroidales bacterium]HRW84138.1 NADH-dependent [FeFe] hydrogenase, group A6 [Bacteroidales bacterium]
MINLFINDQKVSVEPGTTVLAAAKKLNITIPTLCNHPDLCVAGNCRVCVVEQEGARTLIASCATPATEGMRIHTNTLKVRNARKHVVELLLSEHRSDCTKCYKNQKCELQALANEFAFGDTIFIDLVPYHNYSIDRSSPSFMKDDSKCIRCQRCVRTCSQLQHISAIAVANKGLHQKISSFHDKPMSHVVCTNCGQCVNRCPTGALVEKTAIDQVWDAIYDSDKHVVVQTAPAVRVALGEDLGYDPGERVTGKMVTALRQLGFDSVLDTDFTADLTIMEEGTELLTRLKKVLVDKDPKTKVPMFTSCSPGWIKFIEHKYPEFLPNLSTCKSPQQMFGALAKTFYAQRIKVDPSKIVSISIMPCTAKKYEADRPEMRASGYKDIDYVLTTRELAVMIKQAGIDFRNLEPSHYDSVMGESTGAGVIFGATGGVMEAALRTAYEIVTGREVPFKNLNITPVRGMEGVKEATIKIEGCLEDWKFLEGAELKVAIAHGLTNANKLMRAVSKGQASYHFVEIMACPGGCIGGGGQPIPTSMEIRKNRIDAIYSEDEHMTLRKSHENPEIIAIYKEFLGKPNSHVAHELLHTHYTEREHY